MNRQKCRAVVIWIDWYAYHVARFTGLQQAFGREGEVVGIELVGGVGVHAGMKFRENLPEGIPIETLEPRSSWHDTNKIALSWTLWRRLSSLNPEIVLVPGYYTLPALAAAVWARRHKRVSVLMTESTQQDHARTEWKEKLKSFLIRHLFEWAVTGGAAHVRYLQQLGFPADRIASFYDVVGNERLHDSTKALRSISTAGDHGLPPQYFLYVGRLAPEKNVGGLLRAWLAYREGGGIRSLMLVGDGPDAASLRQHVADSPFAGDVFFAGHKSSRELLPFFAFADCFVLPSTREPWGLVVNEAMAASLPVLVSSRCGCAESLVEAGRNGFVFEPEQLPELTACLQVIDGMSKQDLVHMGEASARRIVDYSPRNFGVQISNISAVSFGRTAVEVSSHRTKQAAQSCVAPKHARSDRRVATSEGISE